MESKPTVMLYSRPIVDDQGESTVFLSIIQYENAVQAALYDKNPRLGSMTLSYPVAGRVEQHVLFQGKHEQLSRALAMMLVRTSQNIVYASVNLSEHARVHNEIIRDLVGDYGKDYSANADPGSQGLNKL